MASKDDSRPILPGFGLPIDHRAKLEENGKFPLALFEEEYVAELLPVREYTVMELVNVITDKPDWQRKVFDEEIVKKWRAEMLTPDEPGTEISHVPAEADHRMDDAEDDSGSSAGSADDIGDSAGSAQHPASPARSAEDDSGSSAWSADDGMAVDVSPKMVDWAIEEVKYKAGVFDKFNCIEALDGVWKSDTAVAEDLKMALQAAVKPFEDVPDRDKDWHPGSNQQVLDLVHPSIYPLVYGQSKILAHDKCGVDDCSTWVGKGDTLPSIEDQPALLVSHQWSTKYQWIPAEFETPSGSEEVKVLSYINNIHPETHPELYTIIPKIIAKAIPLWNRTLSFVTFEKIPERVIDWSNSDGCGFPKGLEDPAPDNDEDEDDYWDRIQDWRESREVIKPEPPAFKTPYERLKEGKRLAPWQDKIERKKGVPQTPDVSPSVDLRKEYGRLQIIVKLANIHLTPEKPEYPGGSWHVEGQANEAICASALYYYSSENITDSYLFFRQQVEEGVDLTYEQGEHTAMETIYGFNNEDPAIQNLGHVLTREDRLLCFPNVMQHRVSSFKLADPTKPGHRKILALFLVDPHMKIISTENVPPQQHSWWKDIIDESGVLNQFPNEIGQQILDVTDFPVPLSKAKEQREELMEERKNFVKAHTKEYVSSRVFSLCEH